MYWCDRGISLFRKSSREDKIKENWKLRRDKRANLKEFWIWFPGSDCILEHCSIHGNINRSRHINEKYVNIFSIWIGFNIINSSKNEQRIWKLILTLKFSYQKFAETKRMLCKNYLKLKCKNTTAHKKKIDKKWTLKMSNY